MSLSTRLNAPFGARCFMTLEAALLPPVPAGSQCTVWRSVLYDSMQTKMRWRHRLKVLMHRLALGAL